MSSSSSIQSRDLAAQSEELLPPPALPMSYDAEIHQPGILPGAKQHGPGLLKVPSAAATHSTCTGTHVCTMVHRERNGVKGGAQSHRKQ